MDSLKSRTTKVRAGKNDWRQTLSWSSGTALSEDFPDAYDPRTTDPAIFANVDASFDLVQDGKGAMKGLRGPLNT